MDTKTPSLNIKLSAGIDTEFLQPVAEQPRQFKGVANSGRAFGWGAYLAVVDLDGIDHKPKTAVLIEHDGSKVAGVCTLSVTADGLIAEGQLLDNEHGRMVAQASDADFPWEMSAYVKAERYEELSAGATATVNGREVAGPALIMRDCTIREVSFTPVGVDGNTSAVALSDGSPFVPPPPTDQPQEQNMTPEEQKAFDDLKKEVDELKAENAQLKKDKSKAKIDAKLSAAGFKPAEDGKGYQGVSAATYTALLSASDADAAAMIADLSPKADPAKPTPPAALLSDNPPPADKTDPADGAKLSAATATSSLTGGAYV